ncbi:type 1 glutamine amidotransferase [Ferrimonas balearica]|uniref:type 1 glutamine amidotransferase n=1 Tax=Ferrimonas balearica TaxID=44012 RepID=UPI001C9981A6|nr:type 1 glutamine amidotransferase [Ferrimonas balearica]MBY5920923.1 type 1 glutamine amidotransferase [Ferrimonas balearica]MBY5996392.1 type 1 glutamine amidotransferase [Ferrimonas balearica]
MARTEVTLLLMQIRDNPQTREEEWRSFAQFCGLERTQIRILNLFDTPEFGPEVLEGVDGLLVGGSSEASVLEPERYPFVEPAMALLRHCISIKLPVFCSCFGHQLAVRALGGEVIRDERDFEMGTVPILLTAAARTDPLYHDMPQGFMAVSVHRERALVVPEGCTLLAYTEPCTHSFKVDGAPFWTTQFHPEVDRPVLIQRLTQFAHHYTDGEDHLREVLESAEETPLSNDLLRRFVDRVLLAE